MKVIVPYTEIAPGVAEALWETGEMWEKIDVSRSDEDYFGLMATLWAVGETFVIVEHDVIVRPDTISELENCPDEWCGFSVPYIKGNYHGLACVKFTDKLIRKIPDAFAQIAPMDEEEHPPKHWCRLDARLQGKVLPRTGVRRHPHEPPLGHFRQDGIQPYPSHGCIKPS